MEYQEKFNKLYEMYKSNTIESKWKTISLELNFNNFIGFLEGAGKGMNKELVILRSYLFTDELLDETEMIPVKYNYISLSYSRYSTKDKMTLEPILHRAPSVFLKIAVNKLCISSGVVQLRDFIKIFQNNHSLKELKYFRCEIH